MKWCSLFLETYRWTLYKYLAPLILLLAACDTYVEDKRSVDFEPIYFPETEQEDETSDFGTIYQQNKGSLFAMEATVLISWLTVRYGIKIPLLHQLGTIVDGNLQLIRALWHSARGSSLHMWDQHVDGRNWK